MDQRQTNDELVQNINQLEKDNKQLRHMHEKLQENETRYRALVEYSHDMVYSISADNTITYVGPGIVNFGWEPEELISKKFLELLVAPESREHVINSWKQGISENDKHPTVFKWVGRESSVEWVEVVGNNVYDNFGTFLYQIGVMRDITARKRTEEILNKSYEELERQVRSRTSKLDETVVKLEAAELRYRTVADFTYDWEYWITPDGAFQYVSPSCERITGYTPQQFIDDPFLHKNIIIPEDQDIYKKHHHDARIKPKASEIQFRIQDRSGRIRWIEHVCQPVRGSQGEFLGFRVSNRDITKRKEGEISLNKAYAEIAELKAKLEADRTYLREEIKLRHDYENIIGNSDVVKYVLYRAEQVASSDTTVLIMGETGTGKELIARAIHNTSPRKERPLIKVDCASLPATLIESELFGHENGAFTGAIEKRIGRFELADGATLFLDEIGELPFELQSKLLRVIQDGDFERLGGSKTHHTNVRIIAATNRNLEEDVQNKRFRMDLWYRLSVFTISVPPLRERIEDIVLLVNHFIKSFERKHGKRIKSVPTNVITKLKDYYWPGNVRELENVIERAVIITHGDILQVEDVFEVNRAIDAKPSGLPMKSLAEIEREHILAALKKTNWRIHGENGAAALLSINSSTLRGRMRKQKIERPTHKS